MKKILLLGLILISPLSNAAQLQGLFGLNMAFGGDTMFSVPNTNGSKDEFAAGDGFGLNAGLAWNIKPEIDVRATIGFLGKSKKYKNGEISFIRYPLDVSSHYYFGKHGFGGGLAYHMSPTIKVELTGLLKGKVEMDSSAGYFAEYIYSTREGGVYGGIRYTVMSYHNPNVKKDYNANSLGFHLGFAF